MKFNGTEIFIETLQGTGDSNFVLIHNAGADHRFFTYQLDLLRQFGDVIQFDLPGSGKSPPIASYTMADLSSIVVAICKQLSLKELCLVGLNNGANIALETTLRGSISIEKLILIDPPIFMDSSFVEEIEASIAVLEKAEFTPPFVASFVDQLFLHADSSTKEIAIDAFNRVDKNSLSALFRGLLDWDARPKGILKNISCPTLCILTDEHHCSYEKMRREAPHFELGKVIGSKCWATLEVPDQVNAMIGRFLKLHSSI